MNLPGLPGAGILNPLLLSRKPLLTNAICSCYQLSYCRPGANLSLPPPALAGRVRVSQRGGGGRGGAALVPSISIPPAGKFLHCRSRRNHNQTIIL